MNALTFTAPRLAAGPAAPEDAGAIAALLAGAAGDCLPVNRDELEERLAEFDVARGPSGEVVGCAAVRRAPNCAELRSLVIHPAWRGFGIGRLLVERAVRRAFEAGKDLFCVSRKPGFFESLGFTILPDDHVPARPGVVLGLAPRRALIRRLPLPQKRIA